MLKQCVRRNKIGTGFEIFPLPYTISPCFIDRTVFLFNWTEIDETLFNGEHPPSECSI